MNGKARALFLVSSLTAAAVTATAQIGTDPSIVYIRASATESRGLPVSGIRAEDFKVLEDKVPQQIVNFSGEDNPISVAVMLDVRGTLKDTLKSTAPRFFSGSPADEVFLMENRDKPLNEAVFEGLNQLIRRGTNPIRAFLLITDRTAPGTGSFTKVKELLKEQDVEFFAVSTQEKGDPSAGQDQAVLRDLADMSGGLSFFPSFAVQVEAICRTVARDLRNHYVIGYRPTNLAQDGKWRKTAVKATITDPRTKKVTSLTVRAKPGYYAPTAATTQAKND